MNIKSRFFKKKFTKKIIYIFMQVHVHWVNLMK
jgi:hypothetical protein